MELVTLVGEVVHPALQAIVRVGELESLHLYPESIGTTSYISLEVRMKGELFKTFVLDLQVVDPTADQLRRKLESDLSDFIAESKFGWGQQRLPV